MPFPTYRATLFAFAGALLGLIGCSSPVPSDMFLSLSVSTRDIMVQTIINDKPNDFLSSDSGFMAAAIPLNKLVKAGDNQVSFVLTPLPDKNDLSPYFFAHLEIAMEGDIVDTSTTTLPKLFSLALSDQQIAALTAGETLTIEKNFSINRAELEAIKMAAKP